MKHKVLFICTGNYYRSRFSEILFQHLASQNDIPVKVFSLGLRLSKNNKGPLSVHTINYLENLGLDLHDFLRYPLPVSEVDFQNYDQIIALDEEEHKPMMESQFPKWAHKISYWKFADDYIESPEVILPQLEKRIEALVEDLKIK